MDIVQRFELLADEELEQIGPPLALVVQIDAQSETGVSQRRGLAAHVENQNSLALKRPCRHDAGRAGADDMASNKAMFADELSPL